MLPFKLQINSNMLSLWNVSSCTAEQLLSLWELSLLSIYLSLHLFLSAETLDRLSECQTDRIDTKHVSGRSLLSDCVVRHYIKNLIHGNDGQSDCYISIPGPHNIHYILSLCYLFSCNMFQKCNYVDVTQFDHRPIQEIENYCQFRNKKALLNIISVCCLCVYLQRTIFSALDIWLSIYNWSPEF